MIQWKQRLYAFLLRRVLGPLLDASANQQLHDSIEFSLQEGKFVLRDVSLNAEHLSERLATNGSFVLIRKATVQRLEISLALRENIPSTESSTTTKTKTTPTPQSSFAWRAMKLGGGATSESSLPAVSLVADVQLHGLDLELIPVEASHGRPPQRRSTANSTSATTQENPNTTKSTIGSYVDAALASLSLTLKLTNIHIKLCHRNHNKETWVAVRLTSITYKDLAPSNISSIYRTVLNKTIELSDVTIQAGEEGGGGKAESTVVAMAQGSGRLFFRMMEYSSPTLGKATGLNQDIEVNLNHQINFSLDQSSLRYLQRVANAFIVDDGKAQPDLAVKKHMMAAQSSLSHLKTTWMDDEDADREDLKTLTGIMKQYREAYHLAEHNQLRGGILVPSHAYIDDLDALEEDEAMTFDVFFDANDQSFYNAASVLKESVLMREEDSGDGDSIQTKIRLHILSSCIKVNFTDTAHRSQSNRPSQEYVLITMDDLNLSLSSSRRRSELTASVAHFEIEDAQLDPVNRTGQALGTIDIGTVLSYVSSPSDSDDYADEVVVSQAPCMTLHIQVSKESKNKKIVECNLSLLPLEVVVRQRTLANLAHFAAALPSNNDIVQTHQTSQCDIEQDQTMISFSCQCPSLTVSIPLLKKVPTAALFNRCGENLRQTMRKEAFLGLSLYTIDVGWYSGDVDKDGRGLESSAAFKFCQMLIFACAPVGDRVSIGTKMQRTDFFLLNGRTEVDPYIPISVEYKKRSKTSTDGSLGREYFPLVPTISSFKARQEDEDDELKIDRLLFSKLENVDAESRKNLRGTDPQFAMVNDAEKSDAVLCLSVPEIILDFTKTELETILVMIESVVPSTPSESSKANNSMTASNKSVDKPQSISLVLNVEQVTCSLKQDFCIEDLYGDKAKKERSSCLFAVNHLRSHVLLNGSTLRHVRLLAQDLGFYSALLPRIDADVHRVERDVRQRVSSMKARIRIYKEALVSPIFFRSQMFTPICQEAPSFMFDIRDTTSGTSNETKIEFSQKQVYLTFYHITFRHDCDSAWIQHLVDVLPSTKPTQATNSTASIQAVPPSMIRGFVSATDCNLDYSSPQYFEMESRSIIRIGDLRFASNIMTPASRVQAYSVSLGDLSYHISNQRLAHLQEDSKICRARIILAENFVQRGRAKKSPTHGTTAEALLREMGFVDVLGLDSMDAVIAVTKLDHPAIERKANNDPGITISLTFGLFSIHACKDSFNCFATTIGELQAKLTALTDEELSRLRTDAASNLDDSTNSSSATMQSISHQSNGEGRKHLEKVDSFLLDGYEWTEIDHDPLHELEIPNGDEQVAGWYKKPPMMQSSRRSGHGVAIIDQMKGVPCEINHHHFPFHSIANPMASGDMGASKHADAGAELVLNSRLLIHKLAVKLRFYDGYDWPDKLSERAKQFLRRNGTFAIEPIPRAEATKIRESITKEKTKVFDEVDAAFMQRKVAIMADLLANDEEEKSPFDDNPLPEERAKIFENQSEIRRLSRKNKLYLQVSVNGVTVRVDSYAKSKAHRLASVLAVSVSDVFVAETASLSYPVKMLGEWVNENEHPRDTRFGALMLKMITWKPVHPLSKENEIESDDCEVTVQLIPMRAIIDQRAIHFAQAFFSPDDNEDEEKEKWSSHLHLVPPPRFRAFRVRPWKLKVDYIPQKLDVNALREGCIVELINISPIDGMVITLSQVSVERVVGFGDVMGGLTRDWLQEIVSTQLHKFLANARPFEPISDVGQGLTDLVVLPYEAFKNGEDVRRAMTNGIKSLAETMTFQALTTSSRLTEYAANKMAAIVGGRYHNAAATALPARPTAAPKGIGDVTGHAMESLARGFQAANYKVVIVPYREYSRSGAAGAASSVIRGIPVMLVAPVTGATEALSYTLLGARNALRPDIRREEEASRTGFTSYEL